MQARVLLALHLIPRKPGIGARVAVAVVCAEDLEESSRSGRTANGALGEEWVNVDPNRGMDAIRDITRAHDELGIVGVAVFPVGHTGADHGPSRSP